MRKILLTFLLLCTSVSFAGNEIRNGGDSIAQEFVAIGRKLLEHLRQNPDPKISDLERFSHALDTTTVVTKDVLELNNAEVDAINFPDWNRIEVNRGRWTQYDLKQKTTLVLHEYLGVINSNDNHYQISSAYSEVSLHEKEPRNMEFSIYSGVGSNFGYFRKVSRPMLGGSVAFLVSKNWALGVGLDSFRYSENYYYLKTYLNVTQISAFAKYWMGQFGRFRTYGIFGLNRTKSSIEENYAEDERLRRIYVWDEKSHFGSNLTLGAAYSFSENSTIDLSASGRKIFNGRGFKLDGFFYSGQLGLSFLF